MEQAPCGKPIEAARECNAPCEAKQMDACINKRVEYIFYTLNQDKDEQIPKS